MVLVVRASHTFATSVEAEERLEIMASSELAGKSPQSHSQRDIPHGQQLPHPLCCKCGDALRCNGPRLISLIFWKSGPSSSPLQPRCCPDKRIKSIHHQKPSHTLGSTADIWGDFWLPFGCNLPPACHYAASYLSILLQPETNFWRGPLGMSSSKSYLQPQPLATQATEIQSKSYLGRDWLRRPPLNEMARESNSWCAGAVSFCCHVQTQCWPLLPLKPRRAPRSGAPRGHSFFYSWSQMRNLRNPSITPQWNSSLCLLAEGECDWFAFPLPNRKRVWLSAGSSRVRLDFSCLCGLPASSSCLQFALSMMNRSF